MKIFAVYLLFFIPFVTFGQLFPKYPEFRGNIEKVIETRYGKENKTLKFWEKIFLPAPLSGWQYIYDFDKNSNLLSRINTFQGEIRAEYRYQRDTTNNTSIEREINAGNDPEHAGDYTESEKTTNKSGQITDVKYSYFSAKSNVRHLFQIEQNLEYQNNRLVSFIRQPVNENGEISSGEKCSLVYDKSGKLIRVERKDLGTGFTTIISYIYDQNGLPNHFLVDLLTEIQEFGKENQIQDIFYKYDAQGNWIRKYWKADGVYVLEAKRKIKYQ